MFYYAEINSEYQVINKYCLTEESTNPNYILITEDLYTNGNELGDIVGQFYNTLTGVIEIVDPGWDMGQTCWMRYKDSQMRLSTKLDNMDKATSLKADIDHTHEGYANSDDLQALEDVVDTKANANHTHTEYALVGHTHDNYATQVALDALGVEIDGKADESHTHSEYASSTHLHDEYSDVNHNHDSDYAPLYHSHTDYVDSTTFNALASEVDGKADASHTHSNYAITTHNHDTSDDALGSASNALTSAKAYADELIADEVANRDSAIATAKSSAISTAASDATTKANNALASAKTYTDSAVETAKNDLLNGAGTAYDTLKELGDLIDENVDAIEALEAVAAGKANATHTHAISDIINLQSTLDGKAASSHGTHVTYSTTVPVMDGTASVGTASTVARSDHKHPTDTSRAAQTSLDSHTSNKSNPHDVTLAQLGVTATAAELNTLDGITATVAELNYVDGVTSNIQTQLNAKQATVTGGASTITSSNLTASRALVSDSSGKVEVSAVTSTELGYLDGVTGNVQTQLNNKMSSQPTGIEINSSGSLKGYGGFIDFHYVDANGNASANTDYSSRIIENGDGIISVNDVTFNRNGKKVVATTFEGALNGNAATATKLATARTISLAGDVTGSTSFDGSGDVSITTTIADDSHNHIIANIDGLQAALDEKSATSHTHNSDYISKDLQMTADNGDVSISWSGKDVVAQFKSLTSGMHTAYSPVGCTNNPNATESFRFMCHKVGATTYGWVMAFGSSGSVYTGYVNGGTWQGWRAIWEYAPQPLWSGGANGGYYMTATHSVTPSKKLSECRNGWLLLWSDYDVGAQANNTDFATTLIPKRAYTGQMWSSAPFYCDVPSYQAGSATDSEQRVIKLLTISDTTITGAEYNATAPRNDVVLRAVYEW